MSHFLNGQDRKRRQPNAVLAWLCIVLVVLPSCRIPCLREAEPGPDLPDTFNGRISAESSSQVSIPEFFNDPVLTCLIEEALVGNQQLKILAEDIQIANNEILARKGAYFPFFNIGAGAGVMKPSVYTPQGAVEDQLQYLPGQHFPRPLPNFLIATDLTWQVDIWRQLRNARDAAALRYLGTAEGRNYVVTRLVADVAENYYTLMALDKKLENLDSIIQLQEKSLDIAKALKEAARVTELPVQRFIAELRKNHSEKLIIQQEIIEAENRINFALGRYPMPVERHSDRFIELHMSPLNVGVPVQLLSNRPDIRQAERDLAAAGLDVKVARARFYPTLNITGTVGFEAFNPKYLFFTPESIVGGVAGSLVAPLINRAAIKADYMSANARQIQALVNYQRTTLDAFTEVINRVSKVENYGKSIEIKKQQLEALEESVDVAGRLFQNARTEYLDVLYAQRDLMDARMVLIETKRQQVSAVVNTYQALGGGGGGLPPVFDFAPVAVPPSLIELDPEDESIVPPEPLPDDAKAGD
ncbi:TolC family protein [Schlesneria sp. DSM 10557]|uniref:TolC family protein n=1 Tax=Schlesneria sp. DSM 10557 TaxID=3044399 RepID=UPI0035A17030